MSRSSTAAYRRSLTLEDYRRLKNVSMGLDPCSYDVVSPYEKDPVAARVAIAFAKAKGFIIDKKSERRIVERAEEYQKSHC